MTPEQINAFKEALIQAADEFIKNGGKVIAGSFYSGHKHMCPISCLAQDAEESDPYFYNKVSEKMGFTVSSAEMWSFIDGFDGWVRKEYPEMNKIGVELRAKYITKGQDDV